MLEPNSTGLGRPRLRLVPCTLGVVAPFLAEVHAAAPTSPRLVELTSPDTGRTAPIDVCRAAEQLHCHPPDPEVEGLAVLADGVVSLVWRNGTSFRATIGDTNPWQVPVVSLHHNDELVVDALRRSFVLPTAPVVLGPAWYWLMVWMHDLATMADRRRGPGHRFDVLEAARWHPGVDPDEIEDTDDPVEVVRFCRDRLLEHARATGWHGVRSAAAEGWLDLGRCSPALAAWHDDASFARALGAQLGSAMSRLEGLGAATNSSSVETLTMFRLMVDAVEGVRAIDCRR